MILKYGLFRIAREATLLSARYSSGRGIIYSKKYSDTGGYALLVIPIATFCLGTWQVKRRKWKLNLIAELEEKMSIPTVDFPEDLNALNDMEYQKVKVKGIFDHSKEIYIGPRSLISSDREQGSLFSSSQQTGYHVVTPFHLSDRDLVILVNRGWVPKHNVLPQKRLQGQIKKEIELVGIVRLAEKKTVFMPKNNPNSNTYLFRNLDEMSEKCQSAPVLIDADFQSTVPSGPVGGQTRVYLRNEHLSYIITWYSLSAATAWMWWRKYSHCIKLI